MFFYTNCCEDGQWKHQGATKCPHLNTRIITNVPILHIVDHLALKPEKNSWFSKIEKNLRLHQVCYFFLPLLWSEYIVLICDHPNVVGEILSSYLSILSLLHLTISFYVLKHCCPAHHVGCDQDNHPNLGEHECEERPDKVFDLLQTWCLLWKFVVISRGQFSFTSWNFWSNCMHLLVAIPRTLFRLSVGRLLFHLQCPRFLLHLFLCRFLIHFSLHGFHVSLKIRNTKYQNPFQS